MQKLGRLFLFLIGFGILAIAVGSLTSHPADASGAAPVMVTNTPLPVQGSVSVANTPNVNVANTPSVLISNRAVGVTNPLDAANNPIPFLVTPQGQPYEDGCIVSATTPESTCLLHTLPSGMRLVIQAVSFNSRSASGTNVYEVFVGTTVNGSGPLDAYLALSNTGLDQYGQLWQAAQQATTLYADPSSAPFCSVAATSASYDFRCAISGYLVPAP